MDEIHEIKERLNKYGDKLSEHDTMLAIHTKEIKELADQGVRVCKLLTETKENLMTRFDSQDTLLQQLLADKHRKEGEEQANRKNQQEQNAKTTFRIEMIKLIPAIFAISSFLGGLYVILQQFIPHK